MKRLYIFDWDGTLMDSVNRIVSCLRQAALEQGLDDLEDRHFGDVIGLGLPQALARLYPGLDAPRVERFRTTYAERFLAADGEPAVLFPGARVLLDELRGRGHQVAVATGKSRRGLNRILDELDLVQCFDATRCADETASKPDPRMLEEIVAELDVDRDRAVMIGDTEYDLEMAARAGIRSVGISHGVHSRERLLRHAPESIVDSLLEILAWEPSVRPLSGRRGVL